MKKIVRAYLANQFGFSETGRYLLNNLFKPRLDKIGIKVLDPFVECANELNFSYIETLRLFKDRKKYWEEFSKKVASINNRLMQGADCLLAILDGGHAIDDGVASEIGYYAGIKRGPIFALRSDFRCGENIGTLINPQILGYIIQSKGKLCEPPDAIENWFKAVKAFRQAI